MDPRLQRRVQRYGWDKAADSYEGYWQEQLRPAQDLLLEMAALAPGERVLEVACGTGLVTLRAADEVGETGSVLATDLSDRMVEAVAATAEQRGLAGISSRRMDAEDLAVEDGSFDAALCALGLMYVPDPVVAIGEMRRAVRPGGRVVSAVWGRRDRCGWAEIFPIVDARVNTEVCPMFFQLGTGETQELSFRKAGFEEVESRRIETVLHYDSAEAAIGAAFVGGPVAMAYSRFDADTREEAHAAYLASIEPFRSGDGFEIPGEFVVTRGVRQAGAV